MRPKDGCLSVVDSTDADYAKQREAAKNNPQDRYITDKYDPQVQKGLEILRGRLK